MVETPQEVQKTPVSEPVVEVVDQEPHEFSTITKLSPEIRQRIMEAQSKVESVEQQKQRLNLKLLLNSTLALKQGVKLRDIEKKRMLPLSLMKKSGRALTEAFLVQWAVIHNELTMVNAKNFFRKVRSGLVGMPTEISDDDQAEAVIEFVEADAIFQQVNFKEIIKKFWSRRSGKVKYVDGRWPKQDESQIYDKTFLSDESSFSLLVEFAKERQDPADIIASDVETINPLQVLSTIAQEAIHKISEERVKAAKLPQSGDGMSTVAMPLMRSWYQDNMSLPVDRRLADTERPERHPAYDYAVNLHYRGHFKKVFLNAEAVAQGKNDMCYYLIEKAFEMPNGPDLVANGWQPLPIDTPEEMDARAFDQHRKVQENYADRMDTAAYWAADLALVVADEGNNLDRTQRSRDSYTYGTGIPMVVRVGFKTNDDGSVGIQNLSAKESHFWSDGRPAHTDMVGQTTKTKKADAVTYSETDGWVQKALQTCIADPIPTQNIDLRTQAVLEHFDPRVSPEYDQKMLNEREASVLEFKFTKEQASLNKLTEKYGSVDTPLKYATAHNLFTLAMMIVLEKGDAHFLDVDLKSGGLAPAQAVMNEPLRRALLDANHEFSRKEYQLLLDTLQFLGDRRQEAANGEGAIQILATVAAGVGLPGKVGLVENLGKVFDPDRTDLVTNSKILISTLFAKSGAFYQRQGIANGAFSSAFSSAHQHLTVGALQTDEDEITVTVRRKTVDEAPFSQEELARRFQLVWSRLLAVLLPPEVPTAAKTSSLTGENESPTKW